MKNNPFVSSRLRLLGGVAIAGAIVLVGGISIAPDRVWSNLLLDAFYMLTIGLGGAVFLALTGVCVAGWHVAFRRVPEALARIIPVAGAAILAVLAVRMSDYGWRPPGDGDAGTFWFKQFWLTPSFWIMRSVAYVLLWTLLSRAILVRSRQQDMSRDDQIATGTGRLSAVFLAVYAVTFSLASVDWLMALDPLWFSTIWGVYNFAGMMQSALAVVVVLGLLLRSHGGPLAGVFRDEHLHDLGKLLLGFSCFWMYIWFSQYMLIWYSNLPEETSYFITRTRGPWSPLVVLSIVLNWGLPFFLLLPQAAKRSPSMMAKVAVVVLIGRWVDLYLMIFPETIGPAPVFGIWEAAAIALLVGLTLWLLLRSFASGNPIPRRDPYLDESLHYHAA